MKILWLSRHAATADQVQNLKKSFGDVEISQRSQTVSSGREVRELMNEEGCDRVVTVLPVNLLEQVLREGIIPIRAVMNRTLDENGEAVFTHSHFEEITKINIETRPLPLRA